MSPAKDVAVQQEPSATALAITQPGAQRALAAVQESLGPGEHLTVDLLPSAKIPAGGGRVWDEPAGTPREVIEGVVVLRQPVRAYWKENFASSGGGTPPDCASFDMENGIGDNGSASIGAHSCATCPLSEFGTAVGDDGSQKAGQACRQITRMFVLTDQSVLPVMVSLPPSSFKPAQKYVVNQAAQSRPYPAVVTRIGLEQDNSQDGIKYSKATFAEVRPLTDEEQVVIDEYRNGKDGQSGMVDYLRAVSIERAAE